MWKETHSNIVWFSEIVDRHPRCFLWMLYEQISRMEAGCVWAEGLVVGGFFWRDFFCSNGVLPASASAEVSSVTVRSCRDVIPVFSDTLTGRGGRRVGEGQPESKSYRRKCHVWFLGAFSPGLWALIRVYLQRCSWASLNKPWPFICSRHFNIQLYRRTKW